MILINNIAIFSASIAKAIGRLLFSLTAWQESNKNWESITDNWE